MVNETAQADVASRSPSGASSDPRSDGATAEERERFAVFKVLRNTTLRRIAIGGATDGHHADLLLVSPLSERVLPAEEAARFAYGRWESRNIITVEELSQRTETGPTLSEFGTLLYFVAWFYLIVLGSITIPIALLLDYPWTRVLLIDVAIAVPCSLLTAALIYRQRRLRRKLRFDRSERLDRGQDRMFVGFRQWLFQGFYLVIVFSVSFGIPTLLFFGYGQGRELLSFDLPAVGLLGRAFQWVFIAIASSLPGLLYYIFGRREMQALRVNFIRDVMRLDPELVTEREAEVKYGHMVDQVHGGATVRDLLFGTGLPILMCTLLVTVCWTLAFSPFGDASSMEVDTLYQLFLPGRQAFFFGFLGAYFFGVNLVFRRYVQSDLTPKAYSHIMLRILVTTILVWAVTLLPVIDELSAILVVVAFIIGIFPETGMALLREYARKTLGDWGFFRALQERLPLTDLEEINLYEQARLLEEGVESIEHLVHHKLPELMLRTRIPTPRLVYLFDRAALYLHLRQGEATDALPSERAAAGNAAVAKDLQILEDLGIRTATELERWATKTTTEQSPYLLGTFKREEVEVPRLPVILDALDQETCTPLLRRWHVMSSASETVYDPDEFYAPPRASTVRFDRAPSLQGNGSGAPAPSPNGKDVSGPEQATQPVDLPGGIAVPLHVEGATRGHQRLDPPVADEPGHDQSEGRAVPQHRLVGSPEVRVADEAAPHQPGDGHGQPHQHGEGHPPAVEAVAGAQDRDTRDDGGRSADRGPVDGAALPGALEATARESERPGLSSRPPEGADQAREQPEEVRRRRARPQRGGGHREPADGQRAS